MYDGAEAMILYLEFSFWYLPKENAITVSHLAFQNPQHVLDFCLLQEILYEELHFQTFMEDALEKDAVTSYRRMKVPGWVKLTVSSLLLAIFLINLWLFTDSSGKKNSENCSDSQANEVENIPATEENSKN